MKSILVISGSPKRNGNTSALVEWFCEGAKANKAEVETVMLAALPKVVGGCTSCRLCQKRMEYECVLKDDITEVLKKFAKADVIVMATPLYFFSCSAQIKNVFDRMFSLYKWNNKANTMETPLKGKTFAVLASAYEDVGLDALAAPFKLTADYTSMKYEELLIANAGESGEIRNKPQIRPQAVEFGKRLSQ